MYEHEIAYYLGAAITSTLYAIGLETIGRETYEPDYTVVTVALGVALTGAWAALRLTGELPALQGYDLAWWVWRMVFWMFVSTGFPITIWQIWTGRVRIAGTLRYITGRRTYVHQADPTSALATERRDPTTADD